MSFGHNKGFLWVGLAVFCGSLLSVGIFAGPPSDPSQVTVNSLGWVTRSEGFCVSVGNGAAVNLLSSAPATVLVGSARYIEIMHADLANPAVPICVRMGPSTDVPALSCDPVGSAATTTGFIASEGRFRTMEVQAGVITPLWARSNAGNVTTCVTVFW